ncbi:eukaryotic translation initiation factor 3 subunit L-like [Clavelina lepadiformis]|uniref:Eukaryotic translation initiation factor 3 subunit L n=1 Tax=Clavelina lepadiformis TaxID=159417 RepID=A0ABP0FX60_CLALP
MASYTEEAYVEYEDGLQVSGDTMGHTGDPTLDLEFERHRQVNVPDAVQNYLQYFQKALNDQNMYELESYYENGWNQLTERYYATEAWPEAESISPFVGNDALFLILYKELHYRHIYARIQNGPSQEQRFKSYYNYCDLFNYILNADGPVMLDLPNQWLWDIIDEFIYQFQAFTQYRCKLSKKSENEIEILRSNPKIWNIHSVLNVLHSLVDKSKINEQLEAYNNGMDQESIVRVAGIFGHHSLYKMLGYFSLIGLLRLHSLLGDYHQALSSLENINITKRSTVYSQVPECQITTYYYVGFAYMMMRKYQLAIDTFSSILTYIQRTKSTTLQRSSQYKMDMINKQTDQMFNLLALCANLYPVRIDESLAQSMREKVGADKWQRMQKGDKSAFEESFSFGCPKFLSPVAPNFDAGPLNSHKEPMIHQCKVFLEEVEQQAQLPTIRSFLKLYSTMPVEKLAVFLDMDVDEFTAQLLCIKHKMKNARSGKDQEGQLEVDFYIDGDMVHIADTKIERGYADYFIKQIHKFEELNLHIKQLK